MYANVRRSLAGILACGMLLPSVHAAEASKETKPDTSSGAAGVVTWASLPQRIREGNLTALSLHENVAGISSIDYEQMLDRMRSQINSLGEAQWVLGSVNPSAASSMQSSVDALRETFESIQDGDLQKDNADVIRQLENGINQYIAGGQTLYINLVALERSLEDAQRGLNTIDRNLVELRLRCQLGQVSNQKVQDLEETRSDTVSQIATLENTIRTYKSRLQAMMGETPTGNLTLGELPTVASSDLEALVYDADLEAAKEASWTLYNAKCTLDDAEDQWKKDKRTKAGSHYTYDFTMAEHTWNSAQLTYQSAVQEFETAFQSLYKTLENQKQVYDSKQSAVVYQEQLLDIAQTRYERGRTAYSQVLNAQDSLASAQSAAEGAAADLFTAYHNYQTAVTYGILNT